VIPTFPQRRHDKGRPVIGGVSDEQHVRDNHYEREEREGQENTDSDMHADRRE
jgi:hypothetical protein